MMEILSQLHFLRPWLLLLIPFAWLLHRWFKQRVAPSNAWQNIIDKELLQHLLRGNEQAVASQWMSAFFMTAWIIASLAAAGPAWQKIEQPVSKQQDALIIVLDLSLSMYAEDESPSRLIRAKRKISDILALRKEGLTALITYSGDAHVVVPLTDDGNTIAHLLPALEPIIMPSFGSNIKAALNLAQQQLDNSSIRDGRIVLLSDEISEKAFSQALAQLRKPEYLSVITFGSRDGAPIPIPQKGFLRLQQGDTVLAKLNDTEIRKAAFQHGISVSHNRIDNLDIKTYADRHGEGLLQQENRHSDFWQDNGHYLVWILLPLALLCFRRGWILLLFFVVLSEDSQASSWQDLWRNQNQKGQAALQQGNYKDAAELFHDREWKAYSYYHAGEYDKAAELFDGDTATSLYNKANALTKLGRFDEAIKAYEEALKKQKDFEDAAANKKIAEQLKERQEEQEKQALSKDKKQNLSDKPESEDGNPDPNGDHQQKDPNGDSQMKDPDGDSQMKNGDAESQSNSETKDSLTQGSSDSQNPGSSTEGSNKNNNSEHNGSIQQQNDVSIKDDNENSENVISNAAINERLELDSEEQQRQQALEQWLRTVPDDPGQLLRNKFRYQYEQNLRRQQHIDQESDNIW